MAIVGQSDGHTVEAERDYGKFFRSRPGSADWRISCSCGWTYSGWCYGPAHGREVAERHIRRAERSTA